MTGETSRTTVMASARVGRSGMARHRVYVTLYVYPDHNSVSGGTVLCGAGRRGASTHSFTLDPNDANCERCEANYYIATLSQRYAEANTILTVDRRGNLVAKESE